MALAMLSVLRDGSLVVPSTPRKPFWLYPNLLSLDAPFVAVAWLYVFSKTWRVDILQWPAYVSLGLVVWIIYAADRLLDASMHNEEGGKIKARHEFHRRHKGFFRIGLVVASLTALVLVVGGLSVSIYSYAVIGAILVATFFALSFYSTLGPDELPYAKNIIAGTTFAFGTAMLAIAETSFYWKDLVFSPELICFAVLCVLNISAIDLWEHANRSIDLEIKAADELALTLPLTLLGGAAILFAWREHESMRPFFYAILTGAALLQILNRNRNRFSMDALRVLADVALLVPILVFNAFHLK